MKEGQPCVQHDELLCDQMVSCLPSVWDPGGSMGACTMGQTGMSDGAEWHGGTTLDPCRQ